MPVYIRGPCPPLQGHSGDQGDRGKQGTPGLKVSVRLTTMLLDRSPLTLRTFPQGDVGPRGRPGLRGQFGAGGQTGPTGAKGQRGFQGQTVSASSLL